MNKLLRPPILAKTLCVLPTGAQRAVKHACAPSGPRHTACEARRFTTLDDLATLLHE